MLSIKKHCKYKVTKRVKGKGWEKLNLAIIMKRSLVILRSYNVVLRATDIP